MFLQTNIVVLFLLNVLYACIPTQQVDDSSVTTTTLPPDPAYPCTGCPKIYDTTCAGYVSATEPWCAPQADVGLSYVLGVIAGWGDSNTCSTTFICPPPTYSEYVLFGYTLPGPNVVIAYCQQDGPNAGKWYYGIPPLGTPVQLKSLTCVGPYVPIGKKK